MKSQTLNNLVKIVLLITVIAALVVVLWNSAHFPILPYTVSWNGNISY